MSHSRFEFPLPDEIGYEGMGDFSTDAFGALVQISYMEKDGLVDYKPITEFNPAASPSPQEGEA